MRRRRGQGGVTTWGVNMLSLETLLSLMDDLESSSVERTISSTNTDKFCEAICAFANDISGSGKPGFLLIGVKDDGKLSGLNADDRILQSLASIASDGNILPAPSLTVEKHSFASGGDVVVVTVQPSSLPPVRYKGRVSIRRGPRKSYANDSDEKLLVERRTAGMLPFDSQACVGSTLTDLSLVLFTAGYRPLAVDAEVIAENGRSIELQLASLRYYDLHKNCPTHAAIILFGINPLYFIQHGYIQYVKYSGTGLDCDILSEKQFRGDLLTVLGELDTLAKDVPIIKPVVETSLTEKMVADYPPGALRELLMNAVMHRAYDQPSPIRIIHYADRIEIINPGPLYGLANATNFPTQTSYRNPVIAEAMKVLGFVNRFGRGIARAQATLEKNGSPPAKFQLGDTFFMATIEAKS
jgi:ATP-dependent DNA helicase RecG